MLVKHALPVLEAAVAPKHWRLGAEGEAQSRELAAALMPFLPCHLVASPEPKARKTAEIVARELRIPLRTVLGLEEFDRPAMPILSAEEHERVYAAIFRDPQTPVLGVESAAMALSRFSSAIDQALHATPADHNLVVIAHGTVIALYVAQHTGEDAFEIWKTLRCGGFRTLARHGR